MSERSGTVLTDRVQYYDTLVTNKGKNPEVFYNAFGEGVEVKPGETKKIIKARLTREQVLVVDAETIVPEDEDEDEPEEEEPDGSAGSSNSKPNKV